MPRRYAPLRNDDTSNEELYELDPAGNGHNTLAGNGPSYVNVASLFMPKHVDDALNAYTTGQAGESDSDSDLDLDEPYRKEKSDTSKLVEEKQKGLDLESQPVWARGNTSQKASKVWTKHFIALYHHSLLNELF